MGGKGLNEETVCHMLHLLGKLDAARLPRLRHHAHQFVGDVRFFQICDFVASQLQVNSGDRAGNMMGLGGADDR